MRGFCHGVRISGGYGGTHRVHNPKWWMLWSHLMWLWWRLRGHERGLVVFNALIPGKGVVPIEVRTVSVDRPTRRPL